MRGFEIVVDVVSAFYVDLPQMCGANVRLDQEGRRVNGATALPRALEQRSVTLRARKQSGSTDKYLFLCFDSQHYRHHRRRRCGRLADN